VKATYASKNQKNAVSTAMTETKLKVLDERVTSTNLLARWLSWSSVELVDR
jgi:hypothetical protein